MFAGEFARYWSQANQPRDDRTDRRRPGLQTVADRPARRRTFRRKAGRSHRASRAPQAGDAAASQIEGARFDDARRIEFSTFANYAAFATMLNARNAPMAQPDETLSKLAAEIVGDATSPRLKAVRIHHWVARNIRYVGVGFEDGGWTSQPASAVLAVRYGDCKAHASC